MTIFNLNPVTDTPVANDEPVADTQVTDDSTVDTTETTDANTSTSIVLDGPLSKIYTQALNEVYANESAEEDTQLLIAGQHDGHVLDDHDLYVYCCDDDITSDELLEGTSKLTIALDSKRYSRMLVSIESHGVVNSRISLLERHASALGIKVCFSRKRALETICGTPQ